MLPALYDQVEAIYKQLLESKPRLLTTFQAILSHVWNAFQECLLPWRKKPTTASRTAFLDGLRGFASLFVSFFHLRMGYTNAVHVGYGAWPNDHSLLQLPIIKLVFTGTQMVTIFFLVSGYSLAIGSFRDLKAANVPKSLERIRSSIFRRFFRLYLPTVGSSFIVFCCIRLGLYDWGHQVDERMVFREPEAEVYNSTSLQFQDWTKETLIFVNVFAKPRHQYYAHSWSIPVEFESSVLLYVALLALCKLRPLPRAAVHAMLVLYCHFYSAYFLWTFLIGAALAQADTIFQDDEDEAFERKSSWRFAGKLALFILGLYLMSYPEWDGEHSLSFNMRTLLIHPRLQDSWLYFSGKTLAELV